MGAEASNSACPGNLKEAVVSLICTICIKGPSRQFDAMLPRLTNNRC